MGWIFTDLLAEDSIKGTVKHLRGADSYFLSAEETVTAAYLQTKHPNMCKIAKNGCFGSKFVTVCATGNSENQIHFEAYQISNQGMALVRDNCLVPTHDCPGLAYAKESSSEQYVPDVFYKYKDEFGNERTQLGRPLPIEYLLIDVPSGLPKDEVLFFDKHGKEVGDMSVNPILNKMEIVNRVSAFQNYQNLSDVIGERPKPASENSKPIKSE